MESLFSGDDTNGDSVASEQKIRSLRDTLGRTMSRAKRQRSKSLTINIGSNEAQDEREASSSVPGGNLLHVCKPVSVYLIRLPESIVKQYTATATRKSRSGRKKRFYQWKHGSLVRSKTIANRRKLKTLRSKLNKILPQPDIAEKTVPETVENTICSEPHGSVENDESAQFPRKQLAQKNEKVDEKIEIYENSGAREIDVAETHEYQLSFNNDTNLVPPTENPADDKSQTPQSTIPLLTQRVYNQNNDVLVEKLNEDPNRLIPRNATKRKRKSRLESVGSMKRRRSSQRLIATKISADASLSENSPETVETNFAKSNNDLSRKSDEEPRLIERLRETKENEATNKPIVVVNRLDNSRSPMVQKWKNQVELERPDGPAGNSILPSPPDNRSAESNAEKNDENIPASTYDLAESATDKYNVEDSCTSENDSERTRPNQDRSPGKNWLASFDAGIKISSDIVMCDSNEEDLEDDDEIIGFMSTRRRAKLRTKSTSSGEELNERKRPRTRSSLASTETPPLNRSDSLPDLHQTVRRLRRTEQRRNTPDDSRSENSSNCNDSEGPKSFLSNACRKYPSLRKTRITNWVNYSESALDEEGINKAPSIGDSSQDSIGNSIYENSLSHGAIRPGPITRSRSRGPIDNSFAPSNHGEIRRFPMTRSRSRAAINNSRFDEYPSNPDETWIDGSRRDFNNRVCYYMDDALSESSNNDDINDEDNKETESHGEDEEEVADEASVDHEINQDSFAADNPELPRMYEIEHSNINENSIARKKLTGMKDAMVVLTRLEDLSEYSIERQYAASEFDYDYSIDFCRQTVDNESNYTDARSDESEISCQSPDPLEIDQNLVNTNYTSETLLSSPTNESGTEDRQERNVSKITSRQSPSITANNVEMIRGSGSKGSCLEAIENESTSKMDDELSQESTESEVDITLRVEDRLCQESTGTEVVLTPMADDKSCRKTSEPGVDLTLIVDDGWSRETTESEVDARLVLEDRCCQETTESEVEITLRVEDSRSRESPDSEIDMPLVIDENSSRDLTESDVELSYPNESERTVIETRTGKSADEISALGAGNDEETSMHSPAKSSELIDEQLKRCQCDEQQRDNRRFKCLHYTPQHKCITCKSVFKDSDMLEQHRTSSKYCNGGFPCNACHAIFMTLIDRSRHWETCAAQISGKSNALEQTTDGDTTAETPPPTSEATTSESPRSKCAKKHKPQAQKNTAKKCRFKLRCRIDNLACTVCSAKFSTKTELSEHLFKHSSLEHQEAYRSLKAKAMADSQIEGAAKAIEISSTVNNDEVAKEQTNGDVTIHFGSDEIPAKNISTNDGQLVITNVSSIAPSTEKDDSSGESQATVCLCHRDNDPQPPDDTSLQIEMVLLCKYCQILFRRRECLEVHYRTNSHCASDGNRERCPRLFCANCQTTLHSWTDMGNHLEVHARQKGDRAVRFVCNICRVVFIGFGTLYYNHWVVHSKNPTFVGGRYNFPKFSVQPIDGTEELPTGAKPEDNYIFVAEYVCTTCKVPFTMQRDLDKHYQNGSCQKKSAHPEVTKDQCESRFFCDVCRIQCGNKRDFNEHGKTVHQNHWIYSGTSTSANDETFRCTECFTAGSTVSVLENHWKTGVHRKEITADSSSSKQSVSPNDSSNVLVTSSVNDDESLRNPSLDPTDHEVAEATLADVGRSTKKQPAIAMEKRNCEPTDSAISKISVETPSSQAPVNQTQQSLISVSSITSTETIQDPETTSHNLSEKTQPVSNNSTESQKAKRRALEDPFVKVVLSDKSSTKVSASLIINDTQRKPTKIAAGPETESYQIILPEKSSPGDLRMVLSRNFTENPIERSTETPIDRLTPSEKDSTSNTSDIDPLALPITKAPSIHVPGKCISKKTTEITSSRGKEACKNFKETKPPSTLTSAKKINHPIRPMTGKPCASAEIIDITDDGDSGNGRAPINAAATTTVDFPQSGTKALNINKINNMNYLRDCRKPTVLQSSKTVTAIKIDSPKSHLSKDNGTPGEATLESDTSSSADPKERSSSLHRTKSNTAALRASKMSFEELRWKWLKSSSSNTDDTVVTKKQGFLRVKNLAELQAPKTHTCTICSASFESLKFLTEHRRFHMASGGNMQPKDFHYPAGITAALLLPDSSERSKTPLSTQTIVNTTGHITTQSLGFDLTTQPTAYVSAPQLSVISNQAIENVSQLSSISVNTEALRSWLPMSNQTIPVSLGPQVNTAISTQDINGVLLTNNQGPLNNPLNNTLNNPLNGDVAITIPMSNPSINQIQDNLTIQQQQLIVSSIGSIAVQDTSAQIRDNRTPALGYHSLPPMVVFPSSQSGKTVVAAQQNSSSNYLPTGACVTASPLSYQADEPNKYRCNICLTFECNAIDVFNNHVTKHYTGFDASTTTQNSVQPSPVAMISSTTVTVPTLSSIQQRDDGSRPLMGKSMPNPAANLMDFRNWILKDTPQGPLLVTPVENVGDHHSLNEFAQKNNRSVLRTTPTNTNNIAANRSNKGQIVYRCMICKSALYKDFPPLRDHVKLVHGITDLGSLRLDNVAQKSYHCVLCPGTEALFDCEEKYREHADTFHGHSCPACRRAFPNINSLKHHMEQCRIGSYNDRNSYGKNC